MSYLLPSSKAAASLAAVILLAVPSPVRACSACGCSLISDWPALGYSAVPGLGAGLRIEYFEQSELRSGTDRVDRNTLPLPNESEIQQRTLNRNTWLDLNCGLNSSWAISLSLPFHNRFHTTAVDGDTDISTSRAAGLGDLRLLARYQRSGLARGFSFQFGFKLPTGRFDQDFAAGPQAGEPLDRGLQLGTGTTDLLIGAAWFARAGEHWGTFVQATADQPLAARAGFLPSASVTLSGGIRWLNANRFTPQLQLNVKTETREHGEEADRANSGGTLAYLSPGASAELTAQTHAFVFVQLPVYQRVNGLQLTPRWLLSCGLNRRF